MTIPEILEKFGITQQELADFTGIPRDRIGKWIQLGKYPPKVGDQAKITMAVNFFDGKTPGQIKDSIAEFAIVLNNIVSKKEINELGGRQYIPGEPGTAPGPNEPGGEYGNNDNEPLDLSFTKTDNEMINRMLGIWEHSNANMEIMARALDKVGDANKDLAATIRQLMINNPPDVSSKNVKAS